MAKTALEIFFKHQENSSNIGKQSYFPSATVGENFEFRNSRMANINPYRPPWLEKILNFEFVEWLKLHLKSSSNIRKIPQI